MSTALVIAGRELREKSRVLLSCAAFALIPFFAAALPAARGHRTDTIALLGGSLAVVFGLGIALAMGVSVIVGDLKERRLSFYFARPVPAASIWIGKASASILLALAGFLIIGLPSYLASGSDWASQWGVGLPLPWQVAAAIVALFFVSHVVSTAARSRSAFVGIDFLLLAGTAAAVLWVFRPLFLAGAMGTMKMLGAAVICAVLALTMAAPVWQLERGRTDLRRSHAQLSLFLWTGVAIVMLGAAAFVFRITHVKPAALSRISSVAAAPVGPWMLVSGAAKFPGDYESTFLADGSTGRFERIGPAGFWGQAFSADGRTAAWLVPQPGLFTRGLRLALHVRRFGESGVTDTGLELPVTASIALSENGSRLAVATDDGIRVYATSNLSLLASAKLPAGPGAGRYRRDWMMFVGPDLLRGYELQPAQTAGSALLRPWRLDVRAKQFRVTGQAEVVAPQLLVSVSADGSRLMVRGTGEVLDGTTAAPLLGAAAGLQSWGSALLSDGSAVVVANDQGGVVLRRLDRSGAMRWQTPLAGVVRAYVAAEAGEKLIVRTRAQLTPQPGDARMAVVDLASGRVERSVNVRTPWNWWVNDPQLPRYAAGQWLTGVDAKEKVVLWNPSTGEQKALW